jgi:hypothetical protein
LFDNTIEATKIAEANNGKITIVSNEAYNIAQRRGKLNEKTTTHKELRESQGLSSKLDGQSDKSVRSDAGRVAESDRGTHLRGAGEGRESKKLDAIELQKPLLKPNKARLNDQLKDSGLDLDDPYLNELHANELKQVDDLLAKHGDMEIPIGVKVESDGLEVIEFRSAREVMQELDDEQRVVNDMFKCMGE